MDDAKLREALARLGEDPAAREAVVAALRRFEAAAPRGRNVRDEVTGPLVEALHAAVPRVRKRLANGLVFDFAPTGKITRDFILAPADLPDHVWEPQTTRLLLHLARGARHVVVGGAYFGDHALLLAREIAATGGTVHAFEPHRANVELLAHNAALNGLSNIRAHRLGLWDRETRLKLIGEDALASSGEAGEGEAGETFATVTLDDYRTTLDGDIGLVMLDIEGGERRVLQGGLAMLRRPAGEAPDVVFEIHSHYVDWSRGLERTDVVAFMAGLGYHVFAVRDAHSNVDLGGRPIELVPAAETWLEGPPHGFNMVAVKDPARVSGPLFRVRRHVSPKYLFHKDPKLYHPIDD